MKKEFRFNSPGRDEILLEIELEGDSIQSIKMEAIGCLGFLKQSQEMKNQLKGSIHQLSEPQGNDHSSLIWKELVLKIKNQWSLPVKEVELCHCRKVNTETVDLAIVYGAQDIDSIRKQTSANTGCGTCLNDVHKMIENRIKRA